jgi:hypothetical protein
VDIAAELLQFRPESWEREVVKTDKVSILTEC